MFFRGSPNSACAFCNCWFLIELCAKWLHTFLTDCTARVIRSSAKPLLTARFSVWPKQGILDAFIIAQAFTMSVPLSVAMADSSGFGSDHSARQFSSACAMLSWVCLRGRYVHCRILAYNSQFSSMQCHADIGISSSCIWCPAIGCQGIRTIVFNNWSVDTRLDFIKRLII